MHLIQLETQTFLAVFELEKLSFANVYSLMLGFVAAEPTISQTATPE